MRAVSIAVLLFVACGQETEPVTAGEATEVVRSSLSLPSSPTEFSNVRVLLPTQVGSLYVYVLNDPRRPTTDFIAWGFDVVNNRTVFFVHGNIANHWTAFHSKLANELILYTATPDFGFFHGIVGQIGIKPPPPPPGGDFLVLSRQAFNACWNLYRTQVTYQLH